MNMDAPTYLITGEEPQISELVDTSKADELLKDIANAELPDDVRRFLEMSAERHLKFDYSKIAEYYAHAPKHIQRLMEDSALVIIDFDDSIKKGFTKLSKQIEELRDEAE